MWGEMIRDKILESSDVNLFGVTVDRKLNFESHIASIFL